MRTKYLAPEFSIPYGSDGLQAVIKLWEIFYGELTISKGELYDRAIWQCSIDDIATIVLRPGGPEAIYEFPFLISAYLPGIDEIKRGWDTESPNFQNDFSKLHKEFFDWIKTLIEKAWLSDHIRKIHESSEVETIAVYATDIQHLLGDEIDKMVWLAGPRLKDTSQQRKPARAVRRNPPGSDIGNP